MRAAGYGRLSDETPETTSPLRQRQAIEQRITEAGWVYTPSDDYFEDVDFSAWQGKGDDRPAYRRLMAVLDRYDVLVVWKLDRLVRRVVNTGRVLEAVEDAGVRLVSVMEPFLDTTSGMGKAHLMMVAGAAEQESANISLRVRNAQDYLRRQGRATSGAVPFGWRRGEDRGRFILDPVAAPLVRDAAERVLAGESVLAVTRAWKAAGVVSPRGTPWTDPGLRRLLRSPILAGYLTYKDGLVPGEDGAPLRPHEPLVDDVTYARLQEELKLRKLHRRREGTTLLSGLVVCGECGAAMHGNWARRNYPAYSCSGPKLDNGCPGSAVSLDRLDEYVTEVVLAWLTPARLAAERELEREQREGVDTSLATEVLEVRRALDQLEADRYEGGLYQTEEGGVRYRAIHARLEERLADLLHRATPVIPDDAGQLLDLIDEHVPADTTLRDAWPAMPHQRQQLFLRRALEGVEVRKAARPGARFDPDRVRVLFRGA
jgi:site-specific DNA recombinase